MFRAVRRVFGGADDPVTIHECRYCGTTVDDPARDQCAECGRAEIARYRF